MLSRLVGGPVGLFVHAGGLQALVLGRLVGALGLDLEAPGLPYQLHEARFADPEPRGLFTAVDDGPADPREDAQIFQAIEAGPDPAN